MAETELTGNDLSALEDKPETEDDRAVREEQKIEEAERQSADEQIAAVKEQVARKAARIRKLRRDLERVRQEYDEARQEQARLEGRRNVTDLHELNKLQRRLTHQENLRRLEARPSVAQIRQAQKRQYPLHPDLARD